MKTQLLSMTLIGTMGAGAALADTSATAATDLNLRAGPGPQQSIVGVIPVNANVNVHGCLAETAWCKVSFEGTEGWAYGDYLSASLEGEQLMIAPNRDQIEVNTVTYDDGNADGIASGGVAGGIVGAIAGGPVGAAAGAAIGGAVGGATDASDETIVYVRENPVEPVYLEGEVVTGVQLPEAVVLNTVPESDYRYAYVNGVPVVVDPAERRVVHIVR
ncbi:DUF1236 domain-containing protein [Roseovarius indicus]|uniref:SH3b domain-containing protein n=1 Tax=Roseovarius indicus TaxID=540747 RepID=A0A0T5PF74_9RHOB|nr:DUF1236 domain-containing protein [Roseovarius indicus]KRS19813.1 hypothetical protein XM52_03015 [Roseovarius indicus]OAO10552.1 hypothetical protein A8B76_10815 [Roseovarius indicus]QEW28823.1 hypothetical protein RIdsm_04663 [Roseovarius indicus]SFD83876.1 SH3 domain-containing protein [Roseovarius indicus]